jgi:myo-inositol-1(or 4)-monophosphatase
MRGTALAATEGLVCLCADPSDPVVDRIRSWATTRDLAFAAHRVGTDPDIDDGETLGVSVGGDGTFLEAIQLFGPRAIPVAGVNRGTLSFLARIPPASVTDALAEMLRGEATILQRARLSVAAPGLSATGINDVMVEPPHDRRRCRLHVFAGGEYVGELVGGGVSVNTPTGSTAMGLSAGGPVHHPDGNATLQIVPLHHERLGVRPVVAGADREIAVVSTTAVRVTVDGGRAVATLRPEQSLTVTGADQPALFVRTSQCGSFVDALAAKLGWAIADDPPAWTPAERRTGPSRRESGEHRLARAHRVAREAAVAAGRLVSEGRARAERTDGRQTPGDAQRAGPETHTLAQAERSGQRVLTTAIETAFPDHTIDDGTGDLPDGKAWLLDPVDGVRNFEHGNPSYCTSVALLSDRQPVVGVIYVPETGELFHAHRGGDARRNDARVEPTDREALAESMLLSGYDPDGTFLQRFYQHTRGVRRLGTQALALAFVAAGSADAFWAYDADPEDVAAGLCILRAAGGRATNPAGDGFRLRRSGRTPLLASNGPLHPVVLSLLSGEES